MHQSPAELTHRHCDFLQATFLQNQCLRLLEHHSRKYAISWLHSQSASLPLIGICEAFTARLEQIMSASMQSEEPILGMFVRFDAPIAQDVLDLHLVPLSQMAANQQEAVALQGIVLRAEKCGTTPLGDFEHLSNPFCKRSRA